MPEVVRTRGVSVDLDQRKIIRAHRSLSFPPPPPPGVSVTVDAGIADAVGDRRSAGDIVIIDSGQTFNVLLNPSLYGYPDATNSGYLGSLGALTAVGNIDVRPGDIRQNGSVVATRPGSGSTVWGPITLFPTSTSINLMDMTGTLIHTSSYALNVANSRLRHAVGVTTGRTINNNGMGWTGTKATFTDCTIDGRSAIAAVWGHHLTLLRCDIQGGEDATDISYATTITDCYIHDMVRLPGSHNDIFQMGSCGTGANATVITHCTLLAASEQPPSTEGSLEFPDGGWYFPHNAVLMIGNYAGSVGAVTIDDCLCDGGNYSFNDNWRAPPYQYVTGPITVQNCRMGRHFRYGVKVLANYAYASAPDLPTWDWINNVWDDTGEPCN